MKQQTSHPGFTLIELIVSIAIFGVIMVSVMTIFLFSSQMSTRVELNRIMQENVKNVMEDISENIRKGKIKGTINAGLSACPVSVPDPVSTSTSAKTKLCLDDSYGTDIEYVIGNWDTTLSKWLPVDNISECADFLKPGSIGENKENICRVLKVEGSERFPLTNSYVAIEKLDFYLTNDTIPKVTVIMTVRPALGKGLASNLLKASTIQVQTTISERSIKTK